MASVSRVDPAPTNGEVGQVQAPLGLVFPTPAEQGVQVFNFGQAILGVHAGFPDVQQYG